MTIELYYFSGTGNSLYIAKELQNLIPEVGLISITSLLNLDEIKTKEDKIGFIFPCHGLTIPIPVKKLLKKINVKDSKYFFAITTRGGTIFQGFSKINKYLKKQDKQLNASFLLDMGMNDPKLKFFSVPTKDELNKIEINVQQKLKIIEKTIVNQETYYDDDNGAQFSKYFIVNFIMSRLIPFMVHYIAPKVKKYFYTDSKCTDCGICEKLCPSQRIIMKDNNPIWQSTIECYYCYACLNFCPTKAVQIHSQFYMKSYTDTNGRYHHPNITYKDIAMQK